MPSQAPADTAPQSVRIRSGIPISTMKGSPAHSVHAVISRTPRRFVMRLLNTV